MSPSWRFFDGKVTDSLIPRFVYSQPKKKPEKYNFQHLHVKKPTKDHTVHLFVETYPLSDDSSVNRTESVS